MSRAADVLFRMRRKGVRIWSDGNQLGYEAPAGSLNSDEIQTLRELKGEIVDFLRQLPTSTTTEPRLQPRSPDESVPLTFSQVWLCNKLKWDERPSRAIVLPRAMRISGRLNSELLRRSLTELVRHHESLRTRLVKVGGIPMQQVDTAGEFDLGLIDLSDLSKPERESEVNRIVEQLTWGARAARPLFEARLVKLATRDHLLLIVLDHLISDQASIDILFRDVFSLYIQFLRLSPHSLPVIPIQFADYAVWQRTAEKHWVANHDIYWKQRLTGARRLGPASPGVTPATSNIRALTLPFKLGETLSSELREVSRRSRTTLVMSVLTAYVITVMRWYDQADIVIPFISLGRHHSEVENTIGFFGVPLFLRITSVEKDSLLDLLQRTTGEYRNACEHHDCCRIAAQMPEPEFAWNPTFNWLPYNIKTTANMETTETIRGCGDCDAINLEPCELEITTREVIWCDGELRIDLADTPQGIAGSIGYRADCFTADAIERFRASFQGFAERLARDPQSPIATLSLARQA